MDEFLHQQCHVIAVDVNKAALIKLKTEFDAEFRDRLNIYEVDLTSMSQIMHLCEQITQSGRPVDILVNNAGMMNKCKSFQELNDEELSNIFNLNTLAPIRLCQLFLVDMVRRNRGHIVNIASSLGVYGSYRVVDYCATKFALFGFTEVKKTSTNLYSSSG